MVEVLDDVPGGFLDLVAGENHVDAGIDGVFDFDGQSAGVSVQILGFAFEFVETVCILDVECGDGSHVDYSFRWFSITN